MKKLIPTLMILGLLTSGSIAYSLDSELDPAKNQYKNQDKGATAGGVAADGIPCDECKKNMSPAELSSNTNPARSGSEAPAETKGADGADGKPKK